MLRLADLLYLRIRYDALYALFAVLDELQFVLVKIKFLLGKKRLVELFKCPVRRKILDIKICRRADEEHGAYNIEKDVAADFYEADCDRRGAGDNKPARSAREARPSALAVRVVDIFKI